MKRPIDLVLNRITEKTGQAPRKSGNGYTARCPAHEDRRASLSIGQGDDGRALLHCHAGCRIQDILAALGLHMHDLSLEDRSHQPYNRNRIVATYPYDDEHGTILYEVVRFDPKDFRQRRPGPNGSNIWNLHGTRRVLFRLRQVIQSVRDRVPIFVSEGEKDVLTLVQKLGVAATCNVGGAGKWRDEYSDVLKGADVIILPDNDSPGKSHAVQVAKSLSGKATSIKIVDIPAPSKDLSAWVESGGTRDQLDQLVATAPLWAGDGTAQGTNPKDGQLQELIRRHGPPLIEFGSRIDINQPFFAAKYAAEHTVLYDADLKEFFEYQQSSGLWVPCSEDLTKAHFAEDLKRGADEQHEERLLQYRTDHHLSALTRILRGQVERRDPFVKNPRIIHLKNGMLRLDHNPPALCQFSPDFFSRNMSPIVFDPVAQCPRFLNELLAPALSTDDIDMLQRYAGMTLLGLNLAQRIVILSGTPGGGKGAVSNVIESVIGTQNVAQLRTQHLGGRFETFGYVGKTLLTGKDVPGDFLNQRGASVLKALCGNDRLDAEKKGGRTFQIVGNFCIIIASNSRLTVHLDGDAGAWRRRLIIIEYNQPPVAKPIPDFAKILVEQEGSGILNWMISGAIKVLAELDTYGTIRLTQAQQDCVDSLLAESDSIREFVRTCVVANVGADVTVTELVQAHAQFCMNRGWDALPVRLVENRLPDAMMELHRVAKRNDVSRNQKSQRGFGNVTIREEAKS